MSNRRGVGYWVGAWCPVAVAMIVIATESTEMFGANHTDGPLRAICQAVFGPFPDARWEVIHHYIRKTGHFVGYGLVGLTWLRAWRMTLAHKQFFVAACFAMLATALVASADEFHQSFLSNRTASPIDVLLDCSGAIVLQLLLYGFTRRQRASRLKPA